MPLTKPNQQLRRDLKEVAALLKWSGVDLTGMTVRLSESGLEAEARELLKIVASFPDAEDKLVAYAAEVQIGLVTRVKAE
ncbi:hypothetical protein SAMN05216205_1221 [Pseudomonas mohnii]|uniref:Uncharacterized protein n=1 Tax=Pseudomonas mohnii TaxID=395600 RepID=A0ABY0XRU4_9PSED|nr:hypothetical protein [Pseudomonas mohnii]SEC00885.1 hypothetical protein SAMN05216205_1221 [Pseudomonas mohnii]